MHVIGRVPLIDDHYTSFSASGSLWCQCSNDDDDLDRWKMTTRLSSRPLRMSQAAQFNSAELSQGVCFKLEILYFQGEQFNISSVVEF